MRLVTGIDGGAKWRGTFADEVGCAAVLERMGGVRGILSAGAAVAGLAGTDAPARGDIGALQVFAPSGPFEIGGICTGSRWAAMSDRGLRIVKARPIAAWRVPNAC